MNENNVEHSIQEITMYFEDKAITFTGLVSVDLSDTTTIEQDQEYLYLNELEKPLEFSVNFDVSNIKTLPHCSRKKFKKWLMACGWPRNEAEKCCNITSKGNISYSITMYMMKVFGGWKVKNAI